MNDVHARIDAWESSGLIDPATAARLRAAEAARDADAGHDPAAPAPSATGSTETADRDRPLALSTIFGPGVTVGEMFAYLGTGFLLGAWTAFAARLSGGSSGSGIVGAGLAIAAGALVILGVVLRDGDARRRRAAGVAFLGATGYAAAAATAFLASQSLDGRLLALIAATVALVVAAVLRRLHAALLTEFGLLSAVTGFGASVMSWIEGAISPRFEGFNAREAGGFDPAALALLQAAGWLAIALVLGLYALRVARGPDGDAAARRRAALIRVWAGLVAVLGVTSTLTRQAYIAGEYRRVIPEWTADLAILALAIVLVERAFRRDAGAFLFAGGVGFIAALTDFNFSYLSESTEVGLLIEGVILLGVGFVADRLRRRLSGTPPASEPPPAAEPREPALR
jgi:hypothetical protein